MSEPLRKIAANRDLHNRLAAELRSVDDQLPGLVRAAFEEGHTGPEISPVAGVSKERVYQIRDGRR